MKFVTLGPEGSCHDNALENYTRYHNIDDIEILFTEDFNAGLELLNQGEADYLVQCSSHPDVSFVTEKYHKEIKVIDTFIFPTKEIALLERIEIKVPKTLGLVKLCEGYLDNMNI